MFTIHRYEDLERLISVFTGECRLFVDGKIVASGIPKQGENLQDCANRLIQDYFSALENSDNVVTLDFDLPII